MLRATLNVGNKDRWKTYGTKGFQLYSLQTTDMDLYLDPVMSIGLYKVTASPLMILYETDILAGMPLAFV